VILDIFATTATFDHIVSIITMGTIAAFVISLTALLALLLMRWLKEHLQNFNVLQGHAMAQAVSHWPLIIEAHVYAQVSLCGICGGQSGTGTGFTLKPSVFSSVSFHHGFPYLHITCG
jgi:hypothetical protein